MIAAPLAELLAPYRRAFAERPLPYVEVPDAVSEALAARLREGVAQAPCQRFELVHRGRYERCDEPDAALLTSLAAAASFVAGAAHAPVRGTWLRMRRGDYALASDDVPPHADLELVLDVSERAAGEGQVLYTHRGQTFFAMTQAPGTLALVARGPTVRRHVRYLSHRAGDAVLLRLVLELARSA
jgi:hypothetical protein